MTVPRSHGPFAAGSCDILARTRDGAETATLLGAVDRLTDLEWTVTLAGPADPVAVSERVRVAEMDEATWDRAGCYFHAGDADPALFEALRRGLPIALVSDTATAIPPEACVTVPSGAVDELSKALRRIVFDNALRARMADAAAAYAATLPSSEV